MEAFKDYLNCQMNQIFNDYQWGHGAVLGSIFYLNSQDTASSLKWHFQCFPSSLVS